MRRKHALALVMLVFVLVLGACGSGGDSDSEASDQTERTESDSDTQSATDSSDASDASDATDDEPAAKAYDPPKEFATAGVALSSELGVDTSAATLHGEVLYAVTTDELIALDATPSRGEREVEELWSVAIEGTPPESHGPNFASVVADDVVVAAFPITVPGSGTTPDHQAVEVLAVDTESGKAEWSAQIDIPKDVADDEVTDADARVVGVTDSAVVVGYDAGIPFTVVVDPATQKAKWSLADLSPVSVHGDVVVGGAGTQYGLDRGVQQLKGLNLADGAVRWTVEATPDKEWDRFVPEPFSPTLIALDRNGSTIPDYTPFGDLTLLDPASGAVVATAPVHPSWQSVQCLYDGESVSVCAWETSLGDLSIGGYDAKSGAALWELTKGVSDRLAPNVSAVFHGAVYGTTDNGPVVLDARTGADIAATVSVAPHLVSEYAGFYQGSLHVATG